MVRAKNVSWDNHNDERRKRMRATDYEPFTPESQSKRNHMRDLMRAAEAIGNNLHESSELRVFNQYLAATYMWFGRALAAHQRFEKLPQENLDTCTSPVLSDDQQDAYNKFFENVGRRLDEKTQEHSEFRNPEQTWQNGGDCWIIYCHVCKVREEIKLPIPLWAGVTVLQEFCNRHDQCKWTAD